MGVSIIKQSEQQRTEGTWKASQLCLGPDGATYKNDFGFRMSIAETLAGAEGPFTPLPGVDRKTLIVKGTLEVTEDKGENTAIETRQFKQNDIYTFKGNWTIKGKAVDGPVTDFNLMTTKGYMGSLKVEQISQEISGVLLSAFKTGIYVLDDSEVTIEIGSDTYTLSQGDFILIDGEENKEIKISSTENCKIALAEVFAPPSS